MNMHVLAIDGAQRARSALWGVGVTSSAWIMCQQALDDGDGALTTASAAGWQ
jgi:hypothetical protein